MERDQEVQGQVTQMRFSLTLMLHQMEVNNNNKQTKNHICLCTLSCFVVTQGNTSREFQQAAGGRGGGRRQGGG